MDNVFLTQHFDWNDAGSAKIRWANRLLSALRFNARLTTPWATGEQTSVEQRINLYHLANQALACGVEGDFVEIGTHVGSTAALLQNVLEQNAAARPLHVYDAFMAAKPEQLLQNFTSMKLRPPIIHNGMFEKTLPKELPDKIAFAHLDANWGQSLEAHRDLLLHCLTALYSRMPAGAVCVIADYCDPHVFDRPGYSAPWQVAASRQWHLYPGAKAACDVFFKDKPETMTFLYGGAYSHGYFRKGAGQSRN